VKTLAVKLAILVTALQCLAGCEGSPSPPTVLGSTTPTSSPTPRTYWPDDVKYLDTAIARHKAALPSFQRAAKASTNPKVKDLTLKQVDRLQRQINLFSIWRKRWYPQTSRSRTRRGLRRW
jgi:uncharacterized protein (DUF305 family)